MRKLIGFVVIGAAIVVGAVVALRSPEPSNEQPAAKQSSESTQAAVSSPRETGDPGVTVNRSRNTPGLPKAEESAHSPGSEDERAWVQSRIDHLDQLAAQEDENSMKQILGEMSNSLPEIRTAALAAVRAFGSREAVPWLEKIAAGNIDPAERTAIEETITYLNLPTLLEHLEENPGSEAIMGADEIPDEETEDEE